jgi:hypothetical protein
MSGLMSGGSWSNTSPHKLRLSLTTSSSGSTRGSPGAEIVLDVESIGVAARDARVEPEHDMIGVLLVSAFELVGINFFIRNDLVGKRHFAVTDSIVIFGFS